MFCLKLVVSKNLKTDFFLRKRSVAIILGIQVTTQCKLCFVAAIKRLLEISGKTRAKI